MRGSEDLTAPTPIASLAQGSMFWQPDYLQPSAWLEHLPALFWLVEAIQPSRCMTLGVHQGAAHFAVCQAVSRLRLDARCYGVQPRSALSAAQAADYRAVQDYHGRHYSAVSQLLDTTPQAALGQLTAGSLDLLVFNLPADTPNIPSLIDLAVSRLSSRGVIVLPGIERREPGTRMPDAFERLAQQYPAFGFVHGDGMGVVAVGDAPSATLQTLLDASDTPAARRMLCDVFQRLGRSCADAVESQQARRRATRLAEELERLKAAHDQGQTELTTVNQRLMEQGQQHAREQGQQEARLAMLQELRDELQQELSRLRGMPHAAASPAAEHAAQDDLAQQLSTLSAERDEAQASLEARFNELAQLTRRLEEQHQALEQAETQRSQAEAQRDQAQAERERAQADSQALRQQLEQAEAAAQTQATQQQDVETLRQALANAQHSLQQRFQELAILTELLEEREQERDALKHQLSTRSEPPQPEPAAAAPEPPAKPAITVYQKDPSRLAKDAELVRQSALFDAQWYLKRYPDIAQHPRFAKEPLAHYLMHGGHEERNPSPGFNSAFYLASYADVRGSGENPLVHYLSYGQQEKRRVRPA
mgnify:CR=1 FL=1